MAYLSFIFNAILLLFWVRLWSPSAGEFHFNPFLSGTVRLTDGVLAFLRPVLALPEQAAALVVLLFAMVFKTLMMARLGVTWTLSFGVDYLFTPPTEGPQWRALLLFSTYHFALFLLNLWCVYLLTELIARPGKASRASEAFGYFARPFSRLPLLAQPVVLALLHLALVFAVTRTGILSFVNPLTHENRAAELSPFIAGPPLFQFLRTAWLAALAMADGLEILIRALFVLIVGNLGAALFSLQGPMLVCHEAVELLLGRFARGPTLTGVGFDFTPLIFFFVVDMIYRGTCLGLSNLIHLPLSF